jgi:Na+/H+-dicarboxylate symporter
VDAFVAAKAETGGFWNTLLNMFPRNVFDSLARGQMMHVIIIAIVLGVAFMYLPRERREPAMAFFELVEKAVGLVVQVMMAVSPIAVFFLIAPVTAKLGVGILEALGKYCLVVTLGLSILLFIEYPLLVKFLGGYSLGRFFRGVAPAQLTALSTSSSAATLPVTMNCVENRLGISKGVTSFVCSMGSTLNMDGTAMYQAMAATFIAQLYGIELTLPQQFTLLITATLASIGAPGIPSGGMVLLVAVLESVGIPPQGMAVILGVDPLLDRLRTVINVTGDAVASVAIQRHEPAGEEMPAAPSLA